MVYDVNDPNRKHYFTLLKPDERQTLLKKAASGPTSFTLWPKGDEDKQEIYLSSGLLKQDIIALKPTGNFFKLLFSSPLSNKTVLVKFLCEQHVYFGRAKLSENVHTSGYALEMDEFLYCAKQRKDYRLQASASTIIQIKISDRVYSGIDVSAGGISFKAPVNGPPFALHDCHKEIKIKINQKTFEIPELKIVKIFKRKSKNYQNTFDEKQTICCQFQHVSKDLDAALANHIIMEARGEMMIKKLLED